MHLNMRVLPTLFSLAVFDAGALGAPPPSAGPACNNPPPELVPSPEALDHAVRCASDLALSADSEDVENALRWEALVLRISPTALSQTSRLLFQRALSEGLGIAPFTRKFSEFEPANYADWCKAGTREQKSSADTNTCIVAYAAQEAGESLEVGLEAWIASGSSQPIEAGMLISQASSRLEWACARSAPDSFACELSTLVTELVGDRHQPPSKDQAELVLGSMLTRHAIAGSAAAIGLPGENPQARFDRARIHLQAAAASPDTRVAALATLGLGELYLKTPSGVPHADRHTGKEVAAIANRFLRRASGERVGARATELLMRARLAEARALAKGALGASAAEDWELLESLTGMEACYRESDGSCVAQLAVLFGALANRWTCAPTTQPSAPLDLVAADVLRRLASATSSGQLTSSESIQGARALASMLREIGDLCGTTAGWRRGFAADVDALAKSIDASKPIPLGAAGSTSPGGAALGNSAAVLLDLNGADVFYLEKQLARSDRAGLATTARLAREVARSVIRRCGLGDSRAEAASAAGCAVEGASLLARYAAIVAAVSPAAAEAIAPGSARGALEDSGDIVRVRVVVLGMPEARGPVSLKPLGLVRDGDPGGLKAIMAVRAEAAQAAFSSAVARARSGQSVTFDADLSPGIYQLDVGLGPPVRFELLPTAAPMSLRLRAAASGAKLEPVRDDASIGDPVVTSAFWLDRSRR